MRESPPLHHWLQMVSLYLRPNASRTFKKLPRRAARTVEIQMPDGGVYICTGLSEPRDSSWKVCEKQFCQRTFVVVWAILSALSIEISAYGIKFFRSTPYFVMKRSKSRVVNQGPLSCLLTRKLPNGNNPYFPMSAMTSNIIALRVGHATD